MLQRGLSIFSPSVTKLCYIEFLSLLALLSLFQGSFLLSQTKMLVLEGKNNDLKIKK